MFPNGSQLLFGILYTLEKIYFFPIDDLNIHCRNIQPTDFGATSEITRVPINEIKQVIEKLNLVKQDRVFSQNLKLRSQQGWSIVCENGFLNRFKLKSINILKRYCKKT